MIQFDFSAVEDGLSDSPHNESMVGEIVCLRSDAIRNSHYCANVEFEQLPDPRVTYSRPTD